MNLLLLKLWKNLPFSKLTKLLILRMLQDQFLVSVAGVIFNENSEILLFKHTYRSPPWGLPAGYMRAKEHPRQTLEREIEEESGLIVTLFDRIKIRTDRETARLEICYTGMFLGGEFKESDEVSDFAFYSLEDLPLLPRDQLRLIHLAIKKKSTFPPLTSVQIQGENNYLAQNLLAKLRRYFST